MTTEKQALAAKYAVELAAMARDVIAANRYFVLGTVHSDGHPRVSPVYFNHHEHRSFYWVSSPDSQHSRNIAADARVNAVVFDSSVPPPETRARRHGPSSRSVLRQPR
jgi:nitroimidazol reductase NimA-like FMN-containing flavoprotein (pyridoxamine 5'-phosphate oxidase superfamily)